MDTGITKAPRPPAPGPEVLIFTLDQFDYVDYWMWEWERKEAEQAPRTRILRVVSWAIMLGLILLTLTLLWTTRGPHAPPALTALGGVVALALLACLPFLGRWARKVRWRGQFTRMKKAASELEAQGIVINKKRIFWLDLTAEGAREASELHETRGGVVVREEREALAPWSEVEEVVLAKRHVFLVLLGGGAWIVPRHCFPDEGAVTRFVERARALMLAEERAPAAVVAREVQHPEGLREGP